MSGSATPTSPEPTISVPATAVPTATLIPADGTYLDDAGNPMPFVDVAGNFATTTTDDIVAGHTANVAVADAGLSVGDFVVLTNGPETDIPRQVVVSNGLMIVVGTPFGIDASGTSTLTRSMVTPAMSWVLDGKPFGQLAYADERLTGQVEIESSTANVTGGVVTVQILSAGEVKATKVQRIEGALLTCESAQPTLSEIVQFGFAGLIAPGTEFRVRALASFAFTQVCNIRGGSFTLGPRLGPVYTVS